MKRNRKVYIDIQDKQDGELESENPENVSRQARKAANPSVADFQEDRKTRSLLPEKARLSDQADLSEGSDSISVHVCHC